MGLPTIDNQECVQVEHITKDPHKRIVRGLILTETSQSLAIISEVGEVVEIDKEDIISMLPIQFSTEIVHKLKELKEISSRIEAYENKIEKEKQVKKMLLTELLDQSFLNHFNIIGACNRLKETIPGKLLYFQRNTHAYHLNFKANLNEGIDLLVNISTTIKYESTQEIDIQKLIRAYVPHEREFLQKTFNPKEISVIEQNAFNTEGSYFKVFKVYAISIPINKQNFSNVRAAIIKQLQEIQK